MLLVGGGFGPPVLGSVLGTVATRLHALLTRGSIYLILDNVASRSFADLRRVLTPCGVIVPNSGHGGMSYVFKAFVLSPFTIQVGGMFLASPKDKALIVLSELIESGKVRPMIDRTYPLHDTPDTFRHLEKSHACGKVVITVIE